MALADLNASLDLTTWLNWRGSRCRKREVTMVWMKEGLDPVQVSTSRSRGRGSDPGRRREKERLSGRRVEEEEWLKVKLREGDFVCRRERYGLIR